jgi:hypothetical protein
MKSLKIAALAATLVVSSAVAAQAQSTTQNVTYAVSAINQVSVTGTLTLTISTATAGTAPGAVTNSTSSWAVTTNGTNKKLTASLNSNMDTGVTLSLTAVAPSVGTSAGKKSLSTTAVDLVTGMAGVAESGMGLTYELAATLAAGVIASSSRTVTFTLVTGP